ncbi:MAG: toll/interleukin-1 receptor domain-containing protein, partial [archaeon]
MSYRGFSEKPLSSEQLLDLFDNLWGKDARELPKYPKVIGGVSAFWRSADGVKHNASSMSEILNAYKKELTYDIYVGGKINENPRILLSYIPAKREATFQITAQNEEMANQYIEYAKEMFPKKSIPSVFLSYASGELALADFVKKIITNWVGDQLDVFIARRDISPGDNPLKVMMEKKLKLAEAIVPICSMQSRKSPWVWWESASIWARNKNIYPLFTNISPNDFGAPLILVSQGKEYFDKEEFMATMQAICDYFGIKPFRNYLSEEEIDEIAKLEKEYSTQLTTAEVVVDYDKLLIEQKYHKYSLLIDVKNRSKKAFSDIVFELYFPHQYLEKQEWDYPHLTSHVSKEMPDYLCLVFTYSALNDVAKRQFSQYLLPGKTLRVYGKNGITNLHYEMDTNRWEKRFEYEIVWKVYIDGGA